MWSYVTEELPELVAGNFPIDPKRQSVLGHSMGGHGALTVALRHPDRYRAASAFSPDPSAACRNPRNLNAVVEHSEIADVGASKQCGRRSKAECSIQLLMLHDEG